MKYEINATFFLRFSPFLYVVLVNFVNCVWGILDLVWREMDRA